ncbi:MAG: SUMF1/EgtB/PvdO family nonheme iron enzyme [Alphaproteobacteria bacterium]|nr:SUMF1/EgtB/PvdO family nonheme iron enzyme [Alphaproteobacteria bacterium]MCB9697921.1 SUMF1/EgtB/PvdO family nonheme iron enzyme [Alphaproteobacteria bacterium]
MDLAERLRALEQLPETERPAALAEIGATAASDVDGASRPALVDALLAMVESGEGDPRQRLVVGEALGQLGDPRLRAPKDADYWVQIPSDLGTIVIGRFPVTNAEFNAWVAAGGYDERSAWTDEGWEWLQGCDDPWPKHAADPASSQFVVANQPVVGVTLHEAMAYAAAHDARLPRSDERVWVCRGREKRPYPWGSPFGEGNANTREEVLGRPCAVGLYRRDRTPDGVADLAGNVAEWMADEVGGQRLVHPGAWDQPSMAAWAKALALHPADARWAGLGFRLARDA